MLTSAWKSAVRGRLSSEHRPIGIRSACRRTLSRPSSNKTEAPSSIYQDPSRVPCSREATRPCTSGDFNGDRLVDCSREIGRPHADAQRIVAGKHPCFFTDIVRLSRNALRLPPNLRARRTIENTTIKSIDTPVKTVRRRRSYRNSLQRGDYSVDYDDGTLSRNLGQSYYKATENPIRAWKT